MSFQGFALCVCVCRVISRERALGYSPPPPSAPARRQAEKPQIQKAAFGGKKSPAHAGRKIDYLISYLRCSICYLYCRHSSVQRYKQLFFFTANGGLFERPKAAFFTVAAAGVMPCMTVVMGPMTRRKTCFPTGIGDSTAKAKPPAVATAFCVHLIPLVGSADNR